MSEIDVCGSCGRTPDDVVIDRQLFGTALDDARWIRATNARFGTNWLSVHVRMAGKRLTFTPVGGVECTACKVPFRGAATPSREPAQPAGRTLHNVA